jgi:hypothetical protein
VVAVIVVLAFAVMWIYIFTSDQDVPDELDDTSWGRAAEAICAPTLDAIAGLPPARDAESPEERGVVVAGANELLRDQLDDLARIEVGGADAELVAQWLADWETYLEDRDGYARALARGEDAELLITARGGQQITRTLDRFADVNGAPSCQDPGDA